MFLRKNEKYEVKFNCDISCKIIEKDLNISLKNEDDYNKIFYWDNLIYFLLKKYQYTIISDVFLKKEHQVLDYKRNHILFKVGNTKNIIEKIVDLEKDIVISVPWDKTRMSKVISNIFIFKYDKYNHDVIYIKPFNIYIVLNGHHSITRGIYLKKGTLKCNYEYDFEELFNIIEIKNNKYYNKEKKEYLNLIEDEFMLIYKLFQNNRNNIIIQNNKYPLKRSQMFLFKLKNLFKLDKLNIVNGGESLYFVDTKETRKLNLTTNNNKTEILLTKEIIDEIYNKYLSDVNYEWYIRVLMNISDK